MDYNRKSIRAVVWKSFKRLIKNLVFCEAMLISNLVSMYTLTLIVYRSEPPAPALSEQEFEEIFQRNKTVSSSAISRAVQDASAGECALLLVKTHSSFMYGCWKRHALQVNENLYQCK